MTSIVTLILFLAVVVCLGGGLVFGLLAVAAVRQSQGALRGYVHASVAIGISLLTVAGLFVTMFLVGRTAPEPPQAYHQLVAANPPAEWFKGPRREHQMTSSGGFNEDVERVIRLSDLPELESDDLLRATVRHETDRETGKPVLIWIFALDSPEDGEWLTKSEPGLFRLKAGRLVVGVSSEQHDAVTRLAEFYTRQLKEIR